MERKPTVIRIVAADAPRETIKALLQRSRMGRGAGSSLSIEAHEGYWYAEIDHPGTVATFEAVLTELVIGHSRADSMPRKSIDAKPATASSASEAAYHGPGQRAWTGDARVDAAISDYLTDLFTPKPGVFSGATFGTSRLFT